jgi:urea-proton symporter
LNIKPRADAATKGTTNTDEKANDKAMEEEHGSAELRSLDGEEPFVVPDPDLDPVALDKAFRFAAWSSVVLVCNLDFPSFWARC